MGATVKTYAIIVALAVSQPAIADVTSFQGPAGQTVYKTTCKMDESECYQDAAAVCGKSYQILGSESHSGGILADIFPGPIKYYSMSFSCGSSDGRIARFPHQGPDYYPPRPFVAECSGNGWGVGCYGWR